MNAGGRVTEMELGRLEMTYQKTARARLAELEAKLADPYVSDAQREAFGRAASAIRNEGRDYWDRLEHLNASPVDAIECDLQARLARPPQIGDRR